MAACYLAAPFRCRTASRPGDQPRSLVARIHQPPASDVALLAGWVSLPVQVRTLGLLAVELLGRDDSPVTQDNGRPRNVSA
jgi:hypothetical protein